MEIIYFGGSTLVLRGRETTVITDPRRESGGSRGATYQIATVSCVESAAPGSETGGDAPVRTITRPGEYEVSGVLIRGVRPANPPANHRTVCYLITIDGVNLCHLGHLGQALSGVEVGELGAADVVFVPVSGQGTLSPGVASEVLASLSPRVVIPISYPSAAPGQQMQLSAGLTDPLGAGDFGPFLKEVGATQAEPQGRLSVTPNNMPAEREIVVLEPR